MTYTPEQISQIVLKVLKEIEEPDVLKLSLGEKVKLTQHPNTSTETLAVLATDKIADVHYRVARNPNTSQETLAVLATDKYYPYVRESVARNSNTSTETLNVLATDVDWNVRYRVAKHPNAIEITRRLVLMTDEEHS